MTVDWAYHHRGIMAWLPEIWNLQHELGLVGLAGDDINDEDDGTYDSQCASLVSVMTWCEEHLPEEDYFEDWKEFDHPQLGKLEIGGFKFKKCFQNPPPSMLEGEVRKITDWSMALAQSLPRLKVEPVTVVKVGSDAVLVKIKVSNHGFLPSSGSAMAVKTASVRPTAQATLALGEGQTLLSGKKRQTLPHLEGRSVQESHFMPFHPSRYEGWTPKFNSHEALLEYVIRRDPKAKAAGTAELTLDFQRGGVHTCTIDLDSAMATPAASL